VKARGFGGEDANNQLGKPNAGRCLEVTAFQTGSASGIADRHADDIWRGIFILTVGLESLRAQRFRNPFLISSKTALLDRRPLPMPRLAGSARKWMQGWAQG
jgi:hypothetical protein